jgi:hypothetical protein
LGGGNWEEEEEEEEYHVSWRLGALINIAQL